MKDLRHLKMLALAGTIWLLSLCAVSRGQDSSEGLVAGPPVMAGTDEVPLLGDDQLDQLLSPVALYPDSLLAQILPASTYPLDVVLAAQWISAHPNPDDATIDQQNWEPSVKALAHYPTVLQMMADNAEWMQALGTAFADQPDDVMASIQRLRQQAAKVGNLTSTPQEQVVVDGDIIQIMPADPDFLYVPDYDPSAVYAIGLYPQPISFRTRYAIGRWLDNDCDWRDHMIISGGGWHFGWQFQDHKWRPDEGRVDVHNIMVHPNSPAVRPWSRNEAKKPPTLPPAMLHRATDTEHSGWPQKPAPPAALQKPAGHRFVLPAPGAFPSQVKFNPLPTNPPPTVEVLNPAGSGIQVQQAVDQAQRSRTTGTSVMHAPAEPQRTYTPPPAQPMPVRQATPSTPPPVYTPPPAPPAFSPDAGGDTRAQSDRGHISARR